MKKYYMLFCLCLSYMLGMAQYGTQFENRGFENWANFGSNNNMIEPVHWHSTKSATGSFTGFLSQQIEPSSIVRPGSSGSQSARLFPVSVIGVTANGSMTNGRMNAGSMSAAGSGNYVYTQRDDERFNTPIAMVPDSLTVWVCFRSSDPNQNAQVHAAVHGDADFKMLGNGTNDPQNMMVAEALQTFRRTAEAGGNYNWRRLSVPFINNGPCNDIRYLLITVTTNEIPGEGGTTDDLFVDDVLLVYNPHIEMLGLDKDNYQIGESLTLSFTLEGTMSPDNLNQEPNQVIAQLSNAIGSFSNPIELGRVQTNTSGSLNVTIPQGLFEGTQYRIRLVTTNYPMISEDNGTDLTIFEAGAGIIEAGDEEIILGVEIFDLTGRKVKDNDLAPGIYIVRERTTKGIIERKKFVQ